MRIIIAGYSLHEKQRIFPALQKIYGIGLNKASQILLFFG
jgi:ribosomal protein S13